ncbi:MAG: N-acetylneuraminate synthase family protein, partial [Candidatus Nitrosomaritimum yanchengensis]
KKAGADAVKFQMWRASDLYTKKHPLWNFIKKSEVTFDKAKKINDYCDKIGIEFFCSAFYPEAVTFLETLGVKRYKVASRTCLMKDPYAIETLKEKASTRKPIVVSMGMGGDVDAITKIFRKNKNILFCYCISQYPLDIIKMNWEQAVQYDGLSDHTMGILTPILFCALKKERGSKKIFIEKHVKLQESNGPDASTSIDIGELKELVSKIRIIEKLHLPIIKNPLN